MPTYIDRVARHLHYDRGMTISHAIASAVNRMKRWAKGGGSVKAATRTKAARALAQWEAKKARSKASNLAHEAFPAWTLDLSSPSHEFLTPGAVWELAISSHGWVPNNPVTALKWRKGSWTPPGGKPIKAADIRSRLGATSNKDAIRILTSDPSAMDKVTGKSASTKRPVRNLRASGGKKPAAPDPSRGRSASSTADPTKRQTLKPNTAPSSGRGVDRAEVARRAAETREANRPAARPAEVSPDMGRQKIPRGLTANAGPVAKSPVRNRPARHESTKAGSGRVVDERGVTVDTGWVAISPEENERAREAMRARRRGTVVQAATKYRPFEVTKRDSGKFHVRDTRDGSMTTRGMSKRDALAMAKMDNDRAERAGGPLEDIGNGFQVRKDRNGWQLYRNGESLGAFRAYKTRAAAVDQAAGIPSGDQRVWATAFERNSAKSLRQRAGQESYRERQARADEQARADIARVNRQLDAEAARRKAADQADVAARRARGEGTGRWETERRVTPDGKVRWAIKDPAGRAHPTAYARKRDAERVRDQANERQGGGQPSAPIPKSPVRNRPRRPAAPAGPAPSRPDVSTPSGRRQVREQMKATQDRWSATAKAQRAQAETTPATPRRRDTTTPRRQNDARTTRQPSGAAEGALFGLTSGQKQDQKQRVASAIEGFAPGTPAGAANKLLRGEPVTRRVRDDDGATMELTVQRDGSGGWMYRTSGPERGQTSERRGLSLPDAIAGAGAAYRDEYDEDLPSVRPKKAKAAAPRAASTPAATAPAEDTRSPQDIARAEVEAEERAAEARRNSRLPGLREALATAERDANAYERRHPVASNRSRAVRTRLDDKRQAVTRARARLAEAEVGEFGTNFRPPTQAEYNNARETATKAGKEYVTYRDQLRRSGKTPTARQQAEIKRRHQRAVDTYRQFVKVDRARGEGEQRAAREDAAQPYRVRVGGSSQGFPTRQAAESAAEQAGFRGSLAQVVTRSGEVQVSFNRSNQPTRGAMTPEQANAAYERRRRERIESTDLPELLEGYATDYRASAENTGLPAEDRAMFGRLADAAQARVGPARQRRERAETERQQFRERTRTLQTSANEAFTSGDLEGAERSITELMGVLRDSPQATEEQRTQASRALDRIQAARGTAPAAPVSDASRIASAREALAATRTEIEQLQEKWSASLRRNGSENVSPRVQANRDKMRARAAELTALRAEQQRTLFAAEHPDTKAGNPTVGESSSEYNNTYTPVTFPDGQRYIVGRHAYGSVEVIRDGLRVRIYDPDTSADMSDAEHARRMGATLDRIHAMVSSRENDQYGRTVFGFGSRDDLASALARLDTVATYLDRDPISGEYRLRSTAPNSGAYLDKSSDGGWVLRGNGGGSERIHEDTLTPEHLRVLARTTQDVDVSHESARTGHQTTGELTGQRRMSPGGVVEIQIRFPNGATQWVPASVVADQLRE